MSLLSRRRARGQDPTPGPAPTCIAPLVALRLSPDGHVRACGLNAELDLGTIGPRTLRDVWTGPEMEALRAALAGGDYSMGCSVCGEARAAGKRAISHSAVYDRLGPPEEWPRRIEFALSNTCNLQCVQCNGELSSAIRAQREHREPLRSPYTDDFFEELREFIPHLYMAEFIGGEPFLTRECRRLWDLMIELGVPAETHVTTNGTVWNERVERYLRALQMDVALSMDGVEPATQAAIRVGSDLAEVRANRERIFEVVRSYGGNLSLNFCVMRQNWQEFLPFVQEADELDVLAYNARVVDPPEHSLFTLSAADLRRVVEGMQAQGDGVVDQLSERNRAVWQNVVDDLSSHLRSLDEAGVEVEVRRPTPPKPRRDPGDLIAAATTPAGERPVHLVLRHNVVVSVDAPEWAGFLGLEACVGRPASDMQAVLEESVGGPVTAEPVDGADQEQRYRLGSPAGTIAMRVLVRAANEELDDLVLGLVSEEGASPL